MPNFIGPTADLTADPFFQQNNNVMYGRILFLMCRYLDKMAGSGLVVSREKFESIDVDTSEFDPQIFAEDIKNMYIFLKRVSILYEKKYPDENDVISLAYIKSLRDTDLENSPFFKKRISTSLNKERDEVVIKMIDR